MIENVEIITNMQPQTELEKSILRGFDGVATKLNEVIDAVNELHEEAENNARIRANHKKLIDTLVEENNIHEEQIDELQMKLEPEKCEPADPYAEQRRWIGKLCKFWFADAEHPTFGILDFVDAGPHPEPFHTDCGESEQGWYPHCEPVKPDADIIYKGGDNDDR